MHDALVCFRTRCYLRSLRVPWKQSHRRL